MHNVVKWPNILWPFYNIMHERVTIRSEIWLRSLRNELHIFSVFLAEYEHISDCKVVAITALPVSLSQLLFHRQERIQLVIRLGESADVVGTIQQDIINMTVILWDFVNFILKGYLHYKTILCHKRALDL